MPPRTWWSTSSGTETLKLFPPLVIYVGVEHGPSNSHCFGRISLPLDVGCGPCPLGAVDYFYGSSTYEALLGRALTLRNLPTFQLDYNLRQLSTNQIHSFLRGS